MIVVTDLLYVGICMVIRGVNTPFYLRISYEDLT